MKKLIVIIALLAFAPNAFAGLSGLGFGVHGGVVSGYDNPGLEEGILAEPLFAGFELTSSMYNIGGHLNIGTFRVIEFDGSIDYAWKRQEIIQDVNLTLSDVSFTVSVKKSLQLGVIKPYLGVGGGMHIIAYSLDVGGQVFAAAMPDNESKTGYLLKAGAEFEIPLFPLTPYGEWRYNVIQTSGESTKYTSIIFGITLDLP
ncbi:MAG: outer membrane beta-barrel protein [candidate division Zixibacteria bacterium]